MGHEKKFFDKASLLLEKLYLRLNFNSPKYWEARYKSGGNSGQGSYGHQSEVKAEVLNQILEDFAIESVIEFGSGDGNQLQYYNIKKYLGLDVSETAIKNCLEQYKDDANKGFIHMNPTAFRSNGDILKADATMSVEVIFHLVEDVVFEKYMKDLFNCGQKYVIIFSSNHDDNKGVSIHVKHRKYSDFINQNYSEWKLNKGYDCYISKDKYFGEWRVYSKD